jgi:hypothetical protein
VNPGRRIVAIASARRDYVSFLVWADRRLGTSIAIELPLRGQKLIGNLRHSASETCGNLLGRPSGSFEFAKTPQLLREPGAASIQSSHHEPATPERRRWSRRLEINCEVPRRS